MNILGYEIEPSVWMSDNILRKRTWRERLFSRPWKPFKRYKSVEEPKAYILNDFKKVVVTFKTYSSLSRGESIVLSSIENAIKEVEGKI